MVPQGYEDFYEVRVLSLEEVRNVYARLKKEKLVRYMYPNLTEDDLLPSVETVERAVRNPSLFVGGFCLGQLCGYMEVWAGDDYGTCAGYVGVCAFRGHSRHAVTLCNMAKKWVFKKLDCSCLFGRIPDTNRHALHMLRAVGFRKVCRIPRMIYSELKQTTVDGVLVMALPKGE